MLWRRSNSISTSMLESRLSWTRYAGIGAMGNTGTFLVACLLVKKWRLEGGCLVVPSAALNANRSKMPGFFTVRRLSRRETLLLGCALQ